MGSFLLAMRRLALGEAFGSRPTNQAAQRCRIVALFFFMAASVLLLTAALVDTLAKARTASEIFGWSGIACLLVCVLCGIRHAAVNKPHEATDYSWDYPMGTGILGLADRLERRFGIELPRIEWLDLLTKGDSLDVTAGDLFDFVKIRAIHFGVVDAEVDADSLWPMFQRDAASALGVEPGEVTKDWRFIRDLSAR